MVQPDDNVNVALPAEVGVILVGALEKDLVVHVRGPAVGVQGRTDRQVRLREGRRSLMMAPPG